MLHGWKWKLHCEHNIGNYEKLLNWCLYFSMFSWYLKLWKILIFTRPFGQEYSHFEKTFWWCFFSYFFYFYWDSVEVTTSESCWIRLNYTFSYFSWEIPILQPMHRFSFSFSKVGIPPLKINIFQRFEYRRNRAVSAVLMVFETLTHIDFQGGDTHFFFKYAWAVPSCSPRK